MSGLELSHYNSLVYTAGVCWWKDSLIIKAIERRAEWTQYGFVVLLPLTEVTEMEDQLILLSIKDHILPEEESARHAWTLLLTSTAR